MAENDEKTDAEDEVYDVDRSPLTVGSKVYVRTVTMHYTGRVVAVSDIEIVLEDAAWIGEGTRWPEMLDTGEIQEVEPYPPGYVSINRSGYIDAAHWTHPLPREVKVRGGQ